MSNYKHDLKQQLDWLKQFHNTFYHDYLSVLDYLPFKQCGVFLPLTRDTPQWGPCPVYD
jgi:hypothetical protein